MKLHHLLTLSMFVLTQQAWTQTLAEYKFHRGSPDPTLTTEGLDASPCEPRFGAGISASAQNAYISTRAGISEIGDRSVTPADAADGPSLDFTLAPAEGYELKLESIQLNMGGSAGQGAAPFSYKLVVGSSLDGFESVIAESPAQQVEPGDDVHAREYFEVSLPDAFSGLTQPVTFRISAVILDTPSKFKSQRLRIDNVAFLGQIAYQ
jgi:hypothetical protein